MILYGCYVFGSLDFAVYSLFVQCMVMYLFLDLKLFRVNEALTVITFLALILVEKAGAAGISYDKSTLVGAGCLAFSLWITDMRIQTKPAGEIIYGRTGDVSGGSKPDSGV